MALRIRYIAFSVVIATAIVWLVALARGPLLGHYAAQLAESLPSASAEQVEVTLDKIAALGEPGIPALLASMESSREVVAHAATQRILGLAARWEKRPPQEADAPLANLVIGLASRADQYPPSIREFARGLALRVLQRPMMHAERPRVEIFAACDRLLGDAARTSAGLPETDAEGEPVSGRPDAGDDEQVAEYPNVRQAADWREGVVRNVASAPGRGLQHQAGEETPSDLASNTPAQLGSSDLRHLPTAPQADPLGHPGDGALDGRDSTSFSSGPPRRLEPAEDAHPVPSRKRSRIPEESVAGELPKPRIYEVMRTFVTGPAAEAAEAEAQLADCGFRPLHFRLAKRLFHEDPEIRETLAKVLPDIPGVRAETWLLYLCHDREPSVRETALGMLLTLDNPTVIREAKRITDAAR